MAHREGHKTDSTAWLRAAVLGANDGLISVSSIIVGVASAQALRQPILVAGVAGMVAGALSMAAGEYVSVSSQADAEAADLARETEELKTSPAAELVELTHIYIDHGLSRELAARVAEEMSSGSFEKLLATHAREELGIIEATRARPVQAAGASALAFAGGAGLPLILAAVLDPALITRVVIPASLLLLFGLGGLAARLGGAPLAKGALRVGFWGLMAMAVTALVGRWFGTSTGG